MWARTSDEWTTWGWLASAVVRAESARLAWATWPGLSAGLDTSWVRCGAGVTVLLLAPVVSAMAACPRTRALAPASASAPRAMRRRRPIPCLVLLPNHFISDPFRSGLSRLRALQLPFGPSLCLGTELFQDRHEVEPSVEGDRADRPQPGQLPFQPLLTQLQPQQEKGGRLPFVLGQVDHSRPDACQHSGGSLTWVAGGSLLRSLNRIHSTWLCQLATSDRRVEMLPLEPPAMVWRSWFKALTPAWVR